MHLLIGVGDGDDALSALDQTVERARAVGDDLTVAVYTDSSTPVETVESRVRDFLDDVGFDAPIRRIEGDPGGQLVEIAEAEGFDRIVLSGGERSPLGKVRLDHVAEFVLLNAHTSVTIIR